MAVPHGSTAAVSLDNSSGSPVDLSSYAKDVTLSPEIMSHLITTFGMTAQKKTVGLKDSKFSVTFVADPTLTLHLNNLYVAQTPGSATTWTFVYGPNGSTSGFQRITVECFLQSFPIESKVDAERTIVASFEGSGSMTFDTY